jgi:hypothetical protein
MTEPLPLNQRKQILDALKQIQEGASFAVASGLEPRDLDTWIDMDRLNTLVRVMDAKIFIEETEAHEA